MEHARIWEVTLSYLVPENPCQFFVISSLLMFLVTLNFSVNRQLLGGFEAVGSTRFDPLQALGLIPVLNPVTSVVFAKS